jgi:hypothetical protein
LTAIEREFVSRPSPTAPHATHVSWEPAGALEARVAGWNLHAWTWFTAVLIGIFVPLTYYLAVAKPF